jgi:hypothetical protein
MFVKFAKEYSNTILSQQEMETFARLAAPLKFAEHLEVWLVHSFSNS